MGPELKMTLVVMGFESCSPSNTIYRRGKETIYNRRKYTTWYGDKIFGYAQDGEANCDYNFLTEEELVRFLHDL